MSLRLCVGVNYFMKSCRRNDLATAVWASFILHFIVKRLQRRNKQGVWVKSIMIKIKACTCSKQCIVVCTGHSNIVFD